MSAQPSHKPALPDPQEVAHTYAEVAQRASKLITEHMQRQLKQGIKAPSDELGIAQAFMDMMAKLLANPYRLAQAQMNLVWDYFSLWQHSTMRFMGVHSAPIAAPVRAEVNGNADNVYLHDYLFPFHSSINRSKKSSRYFNRSSAIAFAVTVNMRSRTLRSLKRCSWYALCASPSTSLPVSKN